MRIINISLKNNGYKIIIGSKILGRLGQTLKALDLGTDAVIITNPIINKLHGSAVLKSLKKSGFSTRVFEIPSGEQSKSAKVAMALLERIANYDVKRKIFIVAFGGGVVGDLAGFLAAIYKRKIPYVQVPTTLLAQIDSAIGGKVGIDLLAGKNLAGSIYQPKIVYTDVSVLKTLDQRQIRNGLAEAVKYGIIRDKKLFDYIARHHQKLLGLNAEALETVVVRCSQIKADVVINDEKETKGIRTILNFGHTIGHAIEAAGGYNRYHHGEAIALGMQVAADISTRLKFLNDQNKNSIKNILAAIGLPTQIRHVRIPTILKTMAHDKKFEGNRNRFVLATRIGQVKVVENIPLAVIQKAIQQQMA